MVLMDKLPHRHLFEEGPPLAPVDLLLHLYSLVMAFYLWMSAYTDLSIAVGRVLGFTIPDNFNYPWRATTIDDFWRRWHITLGDWLKDYIFTPMVRHRWHYFWAFVVTFLVCGIWHGAYVSFVLWGLSQGVGLGVRRWWSQVWKRQKKADSALYRRLRAWRLIESPVNVALCWLFTVHYQVLTMNVALIEWRSYRAWFRHFLAAVGCDV